MLATHGYRNYQVWSKYLQPFCL